MFLLRSASRASRAGLSLGAGAVVLGVQVHAAGSSVDEAAVRKEVKTILMDNDQMGPTLVRLAWHASGTFNKHTGLGGSDGATMRFASEAGHGANAGMGCARDFLEPVKAKFPSISYADLWILASYEAIEYMGGPAIQMAFGRTDAASSSACPPEHMLPDGEHHPMGPDPKVSATGPDTYDEAGNNTANYVRWVFNKMGFNDRQMVSLCGAHALGRCHTEASGYDGPWTRAPETFSNEYFKLMLEDTWTVRNWSGPVQFTNSKSGDDLMMLPGDIVLVNDPAFRKISEEYAADYDTFEKDFATNFKTLTELGFTTYGLAWYETPVAKAAAAVGVVGAVAKGLKLI